MPTRLDLPIVTNNLSSLSSSEENEDEVQDDGTLDRLKKQQQQRSTASFVLDWRSSLVQVGPTCSRELGRAVGFVLNLGGGRLERVKLHRDRGGALARTMRVTSRGRLVALDLDQ